MADGKHGPKADWDELRVEYINSSSSLRELADKHGINSAGVMARASREGWDEKRKQMSAEVSAKAQERLFAGRTEQLARFNEDDLRMARAIRAKAAQMMAGTNSPSDLRALASAADTAQKIGRLALGAETEHTLSSNRELPPITDDEFLG